MNVHGLAGVLAAVATLVQVAAVVTAFSLLRHHGRSLVGVGVIAAFTLMALRRALGAFGGGAFPDSAVLPAIHEAAGLAVSALSATVVISLGRRPPAAPATEPDGPASRPAVAGAVSAREEERELLCYDLHDGLAQLVVGAHMHLDAFRSLRQDDGRRAERELSLAALRLKQATDEVTRVVSHLAPAVSSEVSLGEAVRRHLGELAAAEGWQHELDDRLGSQRLAPPVELMTYRVVQEALNNVAKHAAAGQVKVSLYLEDGALVAAVQDWGQGFDPTEVQFSTRRLGLRGMCSRARLLGGSCAIESHPGHGARITMRAPCAEGAMESDADRRYALTH